MKQRWKRKLSILLAVSMVLSAVNLSPLYASEDDTEKTIVGFEELEEKYAFQRLPIGTEETEIKFPDNLWVDMVTQEAEKATQSNAANDMEAATQSDADEETYDIELIDDLDIGTETNERKRLKNMEWVLNAEESTQQEFDSDLAGTYVYEPVIPAKYKVHRDADLPRIVVGVEGELAKTGPVTGLVDGVLTLTSTGNTTTEAEGWRWNTTRLDIDGTKFGNGKRIAFAPGVKPALTVQINKAVTFASASGEPAIDAAVTETLTIDTRADLTVDGSIQAENVIIKGRNSSKVIAKGNELFHVGEGNTLTITEGGMLASEGGGSIYLCEGAIVEGMSGVLSDQGKAFAQTDAVTVLAEDAVAADNQLTAGSYVGSNGVFIKAASATVSTGLKDGVLTLTSTGNTSSEAEGWRWNTTSLDINGTIFGNGKRIVFASGVKPDPIIKINKAVTLTAASEEEPAIDAAVTETLTIDTRTDLTVDGSIRAENVTIVNRATSGTKTAKVIAKAGKELFRIGEGNTLELAEDGKVGSEDGGSIYLEAGAKVAGMAGVFSDNGKKFTDNGEVTVAAEDAAAADNQLTAGSYVGSGGVFTKGEGGETVSTGLKDGVLTLTSVGDTSPEAGAEGWRWNTTRLDINGSTFGNDKRIVFVPGVMPELTIQINKAVTLASAASGEPAIDAEAADTLTIDAKSDLTVDGSIQAKNVIIKGANGSKVIAKGKELFRIGAGNTLVKADGGILSSEGGGSIYLEAGAKVEGVAGVFSDHGKDFTDNGVVTVLAEDAVAADNQLTAGSYVGVGGLFTKGVSGETASTGLKDGILTITTEKGGVRDEGWSWNGSRLDVNDRFVGNKQIVFTSGVNYAITIKINRGITLTPEAGKPAVTASGDLIITATENHKLIVGGSIEAKSVTVTDKANVEVSADGEKAAVYAANGMITVSDSAAVTAKGAMEASGNIAINGSASVSASADRSTAALYSKNGTITVGGTATVITSNQSGAAMNPAPDTGSHENHRIVASSNANGKPTAEYSSDKINTYKYLKIEKPLSLAEIEAKADQLDENTSPAVIDALADQIRNLSSDDRKEMKLETIYKVDELLQKATGIEALVRVKGLPGETNENKWLRPQGTKIRGALLAAEISLADPEGTVPTINVIQQKPEKGAAITFECDLVVNKRKVELKTPVEVTVGLPPEFYPLPGYKIHHVGDGIDEWIDFIYNGADNTTTFQTDSFSTFSIVNTSSSGGGSSSGGSGGGSGGSGGSGGGGGGASHSLAGTTLLERTSGRWIQDAIGWWYQNTDKSYPKDGWAQIRYAGKDEWYFFDKNGYMVTGWAFWNGNWYYLSTAADGTSGIMLTGWQTIDSRRYYFSETLDGSRGIKRTNIQIGEYYLDQDGVAQAGSKRR